MEVTPLINTRQLALLLGIPSQTLYNLVQTGKLPHYRIGRSVRYNREEVLQWLAAQKVEVSRG